MDVAVDRCLASIRELAEGWRPRSRPCHPRTGAADHLPAEAVVEGERGAGERYLLRVAGDPPPSGGCGSTPTR